MPRLRFVLVAWTCLLAASLAEAHDPTEEPIPELLELPEVNVRAAPPLSASSQLFIPDKEVLYQPQGRPANLLRLIPGFVTLEHSGGAGKADQYLLRGLDADHGTDVAFFLDAMPINLRSHAHGQGYADLNFIIPETIKGVDVRKGPYHAPFGDFATAGAVSYVTRDSVPDGVVQLAGGQFDTQRHLLMLSPAHERVRTLLATEAFYTNGPFLHDNRYVRFNGLTKATWNPSPRSEAAVTGSYHHSKWNASGEIPLRAVQTGLLERFGAIDPSEGGQTTRGTGQLSYHYDTRLGGTFFATLYAQYYRLDLYTNFTFFLDDPGRGDGIVQADRRVIYGGDLGWRQGGRLGDMPTTLTGGLQVRVDDVQVRLGRQTRRVSTDTTLHSEILEASYSPYLQLEVHPLSWLRLIGGLRADTFTFNVQNRCPACGQTPSGQTVTGIVTPKVSLVLGPWGGTELFLNYGQGYHSNDARAVVTASAVPLARAVGYEAGVRTKPWERLELTFTLWALELQSELVFLGDVGTTEPRGATRRTGIEAGLRGQVVGPLYFNGSVTWTEAAFRDSNGAVPLAPKYTGFAALVLRWPEGLATQLQMVHLGARPLSEDRRAVAPAWTVFDVVQRYQVPLTLPRGRLEVFVSIQNLLDTEWEQATFFFRSRLPTEGSGVDDVHFVPGTPRMVMGGVAWYF